MPVAKDRKKTNWKPRNWLDVQLLPLVISQPANAVTISVQMPMVKLRVLK